jgi:hypothetical protein
VALRKRDFELELYALAAPWAQYVGMQGGKLRRTSSHDRADQTQSDILDACWGVENNRG